MCTQIYAYVQKCGKRVCVCVFIIAVSFSCVSETMLLPEDFKNFLQSDVAKECEETLLHSSPVELGHAQFMDCRDYLLFRILQANAQRPMAVRNITEHSISKAKKNDDGGAVIMVSINLFYLKTCFHSLSEI